MPRISIVVPVYNVEQYLNECVDSILQQSFADFELILVDDGSFDQCPAMCDEYARSDSRIRVIHQRNKGLSAARNTGLRYANGEFVCFVDSDDCIAPTYCETLFLLLENAPYDFGVCGVHRFQDGEKLTADMCDEIIQCCSNFELLKLQLNRQSEFGVWNKMFRRDALKNLTFAEGRLNEDVIFSADLSILQKGAILTSKKLYFYRQRGTGIVASQSKKASPDRIFAGKYLLDTVIKHHPELLEPALKYAIEYPWMFMDGIFVRRQCKKNAVFLDDMQQFLRCYGALYRKHRIFSRIQLHRMRLFEKSRTLFRLNVWGRLIRLYMCKILRIDPYKSGHGI